MMYTYTYKLYNSKKNKSLLHKLRTAGWIYNYCIAMSRRYYGIYGKTINFNKLKAKVAKHRNTDRIEWKAINSQTVQDIVERIERSYKSFFQLQKNGKKRARPPRFIKSAKYGSITFKQVGWKFLEDNSIRFDGKKYKFWKSQEIQGKVKIIILKKDYKDHLYMHIVTDYDLPKVESRSTNNAGFDFGLKSFLTDSNSIKYDVPRSYEHKYKELRKAQQAVSRKVKGSKRRRKAIQRLQKVHTDIVNSRKDWQYKLANQLTDAYGTLVFEDLSFKGMSKRWGRTLHDLAPASFFDKLSWVAEKKGNHVIFIDRWFPSSKLCHVCGCINEDLALADRHWTCDCGAEHDRDVNAAINILTEGTSSVGVGDSKTIESTDSIAVAV